MKLSRFLKLSFIFLLFFSCLLLLICIGQSYSNENSAYVSKLWVWLIIALSPMFLLIFFSFWKVKSSQDSVSNPMAAPTLILLAFYGIILLSFPVRAAFFYDNIDDAIKIFQQPNWITLVYSIVLIGFYCNILFNKNNKFHKDIVDLTIEASDIKLTELKKEIVLLIQNNRIEDVFTILLSNKNKFDNKSYNYFILLSQQWKEIATQNRLNVVEENSARVIKNRITNSLLEIMNDL